MTFTEAFIKMFSTVPDETLFFIVLCALGWPACCALRQTPTSTRAATRMTGSTECGRLAAWTDEASSGFSQHSR